MRLGGDRDRFVEILSIDQEEPAQLFTGFANGPSVTSGLPSREHQLRSRLRWAVARYCRFELSCASCADSHIALARLCSGRFPPGKSVVHISLNCLLLLSRTAIAQIDRAKNFYHPLGRALPLLVPCVSSRGSPNRHLAKNFMSGMANTKPDVDQAIASVYRAEWGGSSPS